MQRPGRLRARRGRGAYLDRHRPEAERDGDLDIDAPHRRGTTLGLGHRGLGHDLHRRARSPHEAHRQGHDRGGHDPRRGQPDDGTNRLCRRHGGRRGASEHEPTHIREPHDGDTCGRHGQDRAVLFTNGGHGGPGSGSAVYVPKPFADVGASDAIGKTFPEERFVDAACDPIVDQTNAVKTTFDGWYDYDLATSRVSPKSGTFLVKGAKGELFKVAVLQYYATPDGGSGISGANYVLRIGKL